MNYNEFRKAYELSHKASIPTKRVAMEYPALLTWAVLAMFLCAALLSGVHTAPTAYETIEAGKVSEGVRQAAALATFGFVELGILVSSYLLFKRSSNEWFALSVLVMCSFIAMAANLYSVSKALKSDDFGSVIVGVAIGIGAPLIAALTGKVFVNLHHSNEQSKSRSQDSYNTAMRTFEESILNAYEEYCLKQAETARFEHEQKRLETEREQAREQKRIANSERRALPAGKPKTASKKNTQPIDKTLILDYLKLSDSQAKSIRVIAQELKVSPTLVHNLRKQIHNDHD